MAQLNLSVCESKVYEQLYKKHAENIFYFLYSKYGDEAKAKDMVQESFAKLWVNCAKIVFEVAKSYLYKVAKNAYLNDIRHQKVVSNYVEEAVLSSGLSLECPEYQLEEKEFLHKLNKAIDNLNDKQRTVFLLNRIEKKTYKEIAEQLEVSVKAIEKRMHLALKTLRETIPNL